LCEFRHTRHAAFRVLILSKTEKGIQKGAATLQEVGYWLGLGVGVHKLTAILLLTAVLAGCQSGSDAARNPPPSPELQRQYDAAFQEMLAQPGNLEVVFKFASLAARTGDLEGAIAAYEGTLLIDPDLPQVRLELGILYFRLKSYEVARTYLESALQSPALSPDVRPVAEQLLAKMPSRSRARRA
jgi:tetratricopeptide (TPR) repeat protein